MDTKPFDIHCGIDFYLHNADFMAFKAFTFEDCIGACANFNQQDSSLYGNLTCYGASFVLGNNDDGGPSCYLKGVQHIPSISNGNVDSAILIISKL